MIPDLTDRAERLVDRLVRGRLSEVAMLVALDELSVLEDELSRNRDRLRSLTRAAERTGWDEPEELRLLHRTEEKLEALFWELRDAASDPLLHWAGVWLSRGETDKALRGLEVAWSCRPGESFLCPRASCDGSMAAQGR